MPKPNSERSSALVMPSQDYQHLSEHPGGGRLGDASNRAGQP
jgi:hypothetical protein